MVFIHRKAVLVFAKNILFQKLSDQLLWKFAWFFYDIKGNFANIINCFQQPLSISWIFEIFLKFPFCIEDTFSWNFSKLCPHDHTFVSALTLSTTGKKNSIPYLMKLYLAEISMLLKMWKHGIKTVLTSFSIDVSAVWHPITVYQVRFYFFIIVSLNVRSDKKSMIIVMLALFLTQWYRL